MELNLEVPMVETTRYVFFRKDSKRAVTKHMIFPGIWSGKKLPKAGDVLFPGLAADNSKFKSFSIRDIEEHCINSRLKCYYSKGELELAEDFHG